MEYAIHTDVKYRPLEVIDAAGLASACTEPWWNQSLCTVNDCVARVGVFLGEFHWHKHDAEDELFFVLEGRLLLDFPRSAGDSPASSGSTDSYSTVELAPGQGLMVPRGVVHRTRAEVRTVVLMIEGAGVMPTGD